MPGSQRNGSQNAAETRQSCLVYPLHWQEPCKLPCMPFCKQATAAQTTHPLLLRQPSKGQNAETLLRYPNFSPGCILPVGWKANDPLQFLKASQRFRVWKIPLHTNIRLGGICSVVGMSSVSTWLVLGFIKWRFTLLHDLACCYCIFALLRHAGPLLLELLQRGLQRS